MSNSILITGGSGFLGYALARQLKKKGFEVFGIGRPTKNIKYNALHEVFDEYLELDLTETNLNNFKGKHFDAIIHCANNTSISQSFLNPNIDYDSSVSPTQELLNFIKKLQPNTYLVYPSSAAVYGEHIDSPILESSKKNPISPYGKNKLLVEKILIDFNKNVKTKIGIIRFFSIFGPGQKKQLIWDAANKICDQNNLPTFFGTGNETRDFIFIEDAIELIIKLVSLKKEFLIVNGGTGVRTPIKKVLELMREELNPSSRIVFNNKNKLGDPIFFHADITELSKLNFVPKFSLEDGIKKFSNWYKELS